MDAASPVVRQVHDMLHATLVHAARAASSTAPPSPSAATRPPVYKIVGVCLAICSGLFIGVSFVLKKIGLLKANVKYNEEAGEGYGYLKNAWWWTGMTLMIIGELCNFVAYAFTDAILVTPLGALSVVITTILSAVFLKERLSFVGKVGCFICIVGSIIIPLNAPEQSAVANIQQMQHYVLAPGFLVYAGLIIAGCIFTAFWAGPRYGKKSMLVYLTICSLIGGLSVVSTQGLGSAVLAQINGEAQFNKWFTYVLLVFVITTLVTEIIFLNKALNLFNAALVTPTYYVYFTSSTIVASAVLFQGFHGTPTQIVDVILGFLTICSGVVLLQLAKSAKDVPDTAVFAGDLDQVRTVAEQEEPEYEPRADTIRGGAGIVRALSKIRTKRQVQEVKRIQSELMEPIGENDEVEWDGLRRRRTVSSVGNISGGGGSVSRRKTIHPPLGMSHFPVPGAEDDDHVSNPDSEVHPGFFGRIGRRSRAEDHPNRGSRRRPGHSPVPLVSVTAGGAADSKDGTSSEIAAPDPREHIYGLPPGLQKPRLVPADDQHEDTSYRGATGAGHIQFAPPTDENRSRAGSRGSSLAPPAPRPPPHAQGNRRQFSFQNVLGRGGEGRRESSRGGGGDGARPVSRGALSFASRGSSPRHDDYPDPGHATTEEERLGLVQGESSNMTLPAGTEAEEEEEAAGWHLADEGPRGERREEDLGWPAVATTGVGGEVRTHSRPRDRYDDVDIDGDGVERGRHGPGSGGGGAFI